MAWAPPPPPLVMIGGAVKPNTTLQWDAVEDANLLGYKVYWPDTTAPQWQYSKWVGKETKAILENIVIDNFLFGVTAIGKHGNESVVAYPRTLIPRR